MLAKVIIENGVKKIQALTADTGVGAPVGSIIVVCSNILPSGYLGLGVQYDPTNYPALYQVLGTDTTPTASTLGLPTLSSGQYAIKATSGLTENQQENVLNTINENNSYSTEEHPTGKKWIDGKPIYRRYVTVENVVREQYVNIISNVGTIVDYGGQFLGNDMNYIIPCRWLGFYNENSIFKVYNYDLNTGTMQIWVEYTKTTD